MALRATGWFMPGCCKEMKTYCYGLYDVKPKMHAFPYDKVIP